MGTHIQNRKTQDHYDWAYKKAVELRKQGKLLREIAEATTVNERTLSDWLKNGRKIHPDTIPREKLDKAEEYLKDGFSYLQASALVGVSDKTLARAFPDLGWNHERVMDNLRIVNQMRRDYDLDAFVK